jgi:modification methylase
MIELPINTVILGEAIETLLTFPDNSIDFIFTDPPYGHNNNNNGDLISRREAALGKGDYQPERDNIPIMNDGVEANELFRDALPEMHRVLVPGGCCCCCCGGGGPDPQFARWSLWMDEVFEFKQMVVWDKGPIGMGWHYRRSYETVLVSQKKGAACKWYDKTQRIENIIRHITKIIPQKNNHPTEKPERLAAHFINLHTEAGDIVLDPFSGAGSTLLAAKHNGRNYIGIELDEKWHTEASRKLHNDTDELPLYQSKEEMKYETNDLFRLDCGKIDGGI